MKSNELVVLFSSDDNYAQHLGAAIASLLENNKNFERILIYVVDNNISDSGRGRIKTICKNYANAKVIWLPFVSWKTQLKLNMSWDISISAYARLFAANLLPREVHKVLYMDCDMIVCESLYDLWNTDMGDYCLGAVQDSISDSTKAAVGLLPKEQYFNSGLLLINLDEWRKGNFQERCLKYIDEKNGTVTHHDQGVLNAVFRNTWYRLPLSNNVMTIHFIYDRDKIIKYFGEHAQFYTGDEISKAKDNPVILHFTPSFTSRPWFRGCKHPKRDFYWKYVAMTPWRNERPRRSNEKWYVRLINWRYRVFG